MKYLKVVALMFLCFILKNHAYSMAQNANVGQQNGWKTNENADIRIFTSDLGAMKKDQRIVQQIEDCGKNLSSSSQEIDQLLKPVEADVVGRAYINANWDSDLMRIQKLKRARGNLIFQTMAKFTPENVPASQLQSLCQIICDEEVQRQKLFLSLKKDLGSY